MGSSLTVLLICYAIFDFKWLFLSRDGACYEVDLESQIDHASFRSLCWFLFFFFWSSLVFWFSSGGAVEACPPSDSVSTVTVDMCIYPDNKIVIKDMVDQVRPCTKSEVCWLDGFISWSIMLIRKGFYWPKSETKTMYKKSESDISVCYTINKADMKGEVVVGTLHKCRWYTWYSVPTTTSPFISALLMV